MSIAICMPARYDSKRLPAKLLSNLKDKTIIEMTYQNVIKSKIVSKEDIYIFYEKNNILKYHINDFCKNSIETGYAESGTERISKNLNLLPKKYDYICIIQCDEPFIDYRNFDFCIEKHINNQNNDIFFSTIHFISNEKTDNSNVKLVLDKYNNVLYYSRLNIPGSKLDTINNNNSYNISSGVYIYNIKNLKEFNNLENTKLSELEGIEQLKILENCKKIKSYEAPYFVEISIDTQENYDFLKEKYIK
jgi:3-deoxy-manno-octulosonate cytidylyltransferase (CMP-KDO synthetase)